MAVIQLLPAQPLAWGEFGHVISGKAAVLTLPDGMPRFFRKAVDQLGYLTAEPDRWRDAHEEAIDPALAAAFNPDHAINFERVPPGALDAPSRFAYLAILQQAGLDSAVGLAPFRALEMYQRLRLEFRRWRAAPDRDVRRWLEARIINDAGILGHYITDGAEPLHTTVNHHGWIGDNSNGFATDKELHARFESHYVKARVTLQDLLAAVDRQPRVLTGGRADLLTFFRASHDQVVMLFEIDKRNPFNETTTAAENKRYAVERMAFGVRMLRDLWWTAWVTSAAN